MTAKKGDSNWQFTVLGSGTSQGVPVIGCTCVVCQSNDPKDQRLRSSLYVQKGSTRIVVDAGPDFRQQLLNSKIADIDAVLITHEHQDHTAGIDDLRAINFMQKHAIPIYCTESVEARLREQYSYIFKNSNYPGIPQIHFKRLGEAPFQIGEINIEPIQLMHWDLPVHGFRFGPLAYLTDANKLLETEWEKLQNLEVLILNALRKEKHHSHFNLEEALALADQLSVPQLYLTHISHQMGLHKEVEATLDAGRKLAFDGLQLTLN